MTPPYRTALVADSAGSRPETAGARRDVRRRGRPDLLPVRSRDVPGCESSTLWEPLRPV